MQLTDRPIHELVGLVREHKLDPWDVDIEKLTSMYLEKIRLMKELDIRVPARVLLSAAMLLRMKATCALGGNGKKITEEELEGLLDIDFPTDVGEVTLVQFVPRKITLVDLLDSLKDALDDLPEKKLKPKRGIEKISWKSDDYEVELGKHMENLFERVKSILSSKDTLTLMDLVEKRTRANIVWTFVLLLFLSFDGKLRLEQPEPFGDILVAMPAEVKK